MGSGKDKQQSTIEYHLLQISHKPVQEFLWFLGAGIAFLRDQYPFTDVGPATNEFFFFYYGNKQ